jgi:hypothetical protein
VDTRTTRSCVGGTGGGGTDRPGTSHREEVEMEKIAEMLENLTEPVLALVNGITEED